MKALFIQDLLKLKNQKLFIILLLLMMGPMFLFFKLVSAGSMVVGMVVFYFINLKDLFFEVDLSHTLCLPISKKKYLLQCYLYNLIVSLLFFILFSCLCLFDKSSLYDIYINVLLGIIFILFYEFVFYLPITICFGSSSFSILAIVLVIFMTDYFKRWGVSLLESPYLLLVVILFIPLSYFFSNYLLQKKDL